MSLFSNGEAWCFNPLTSLNVTSFAAAPPPLGARSHSSADGSARPQLCRRITTGFRFFAECLRPDCTRQSLCRVRYSAKNTRQKIDRQSPLCRVSFIGHSAKKSGRHSAGPVDGHFAECHPAATRQRFFIFLKKNSLPSANLDGTRQRAFIFLKNFLCRVPTFRHSAKFFYFF